jgi:DNA-binding response OmpR family regulator
MRILIADDDAIIREVLHRSLSLWGYEPEVVGDGDEAASILFSKNRPRLALLDWEMPGADGVELCRRNAARPDARPTYCILLTAHSTATDVSRGLEAGACDFISKPLHHLLFRRRLAVWRRLIEIEESHHVAALGLEGP